jgi:hypothetical protein
MRDFNYESLTLDDRRQIHETLAETTIKHIDSANGLLEPLPFDLAASPSQMLEIVHLPPALTSKSDAANHAQIATEAMGSPEFSKFIKDRLASQKPFVGAAKFLMESGVNVYPVTNHGFLSDIALWSEAWGQELDDEHWQEQNGMIISRGVTTIKAFDMAASELLQKIGHVFMSFPRTKTFENLEIDSRIVDTNNAKMRKEAATWLNQKIIHRIGRHVLGKTLNVAWSGKTDNVIFGDDHKPEVIEMSGVTSGTVELFKRGVVLPIVIWDGKGNSESVLEIGNITRVESTDDARHVQQWQAETLAKRLGLNQDKVIVN